MTIHRLELLEFDPENRTCVIDVACSKGTYIRTLCHDIGEALGCGGMLTALRRTETLGFTTGGLPHAGGAEAGQRGGPL